MNPEHIGIASVVKDRVAALNEVLERAAESSLDVEINLQVISMGGRVRKRTISLGIIVYYDPDTPLVEIIPTED